MNNFLTVHIMPNVIFIIIIIIILLNVTEI